MEEDGDGEGMSQVGLIDLNTRMEDGRSVCLVSPVPLLHVSHNVRAIPQHPP